MKISLEVTNDQIKELILEHVRDKLGPTAKLSLKRIGGHILAQARVISHRLLTPEDAPAALIECDSTRYGLSLAYVVPLNPFIPAQGKQGIWNFPFGGR